MGWGLTLLARRSAGSLTEWPGIMFACAADFNQRGAPAEYKFGGKLWAFDPEKIAASNCKFAWAFNLLCHGHHI